MLYAAFFKIRPGFSVESAEIIEKSINGGTEEPSRQDSRPSASLDAWVRGLATSWSLKRKAMTTSVRW